MRVAAGSALEVFVVFLRLGLTSFGGPLAHLGYFRRECVTRRGWLADAQFAQLMALAQFLPGPASTQLGFSLGLMRAGWAGALAAFVGFTLPSALLLFAWALWMPHLSGAVAEATVHGLKLVAVAVVAQAAFGMARSLCPDVPRRLIAILGFVMILTTTGPWVTLLVVLLGALLGLVWCRDQPLHTPEPLVLRYGARWGWALLGLFTLFLVLAFLLGRNQGLFSLAAALYRAGALVFGGGHVVLPMLQQTIVTPGFISASDFLAGYGAAQAIPGPLFSLAAYMGARLPGYDHDYWRAWAAFVAVVALFLPGLLLMSASLPLWQRMAGKAEAQRAVAGANAVVVGVLASALYNPVWLGAVRDTLDVVVALAGFALLVIWRVSPLLVVAGCVLFSLLRVIGFGS